MKTQLLVLTTVKGVSFVYVLITYNKIITKPVVHIINTLFQFKHTLIENSVVIGS